ncbi:MAG: type IV secretion system protein [Oxalobacteraceae bacterium]|nr:MAG: type IV secretion system protein [Oxalobacteraceae bacterium]
MVGMMQSLLSLIPKVQLEEASNMVFFYQINSFLRDEIGEFMGNLLERTAGILGFAAISLLTIWVLIQGYRIVTGQSREPMMALVTNSLRATLIVGIAIGAAAGSTSIFGTLTDGLSAVITETVTGNDDDPYESIDESLALMQVALTSIDSLDVGGDEILNDKKNRAIWFTGIGAGGPAITAGTMLLLNKIAMALFVGLGPFFILCLLFDQTKQLFSKWLFYGIGAMFSLAVLSVMVTLAMDMVIAVAASFWAGDLVGDLMGGAGEGITSRAMQQGGLGLILTMLIISAPPMAASFFQGMLGQFSAYNQFMGGAGPGARGPGSPPTGPGYGGGYGAQPTRTMSREDHSGGSVSPRPQSSQSDPSLNPNYGSIKSQADEVKQGTRI